MKIYDIFAQEFITPEEVESIAPPERYIYIDEEPIITNSSKLKINIENSIDINNIIL